MIALWLAACVPAREGFFGGVFLDTWSVAEVGNLAGPYDTLVLDDERLVVGTGWGVTFVGIGAPGELSPRTRLANPLSSTGGIDLAWFDGGLWAIGSAGMFLAHAPEGAVQTSAAFPVPGDRVVFGEELLLVGYASMYAFTLFPTAAVRTGDLDASDALATVQLPGDSHVEAALFEGDRLYVGTTSHGTLVFDVSDAAAPRLVRQIGRDGCRVIERVGPWLALGSGDDAVLWDVDDPEDPQFVNVLREGGGDLEVRGDWLYAASGSLMIYDFSDPATPVPVVKGWLGQPATSLAVTDDAIFVSITDGTDAGDGEVGRLVRLEPNTP